MNTRKHGRRHGGNGTRSDEIRADVARTREAMDETLDALAEKLNPRYVIDRVAAFLFGAGDEETALARSSRRYGRKVMDTIKETPVPATLVGVGLIWFLIDRWRDQDGSEPHGEAEERRNRGGEAGTRRSTQPDSGDTKQTAFADESDDNLEDVPSEPPSDDATISRKVSDVASSAAGRATDWAKSVGSSGQHLVRRSSAGLSRTGRKAEDLVREHPLAVGLAALALGSLLGVALPSTRREDAWFGDESDAAKERVRRRGRRIVDSSKTIATHTADEIRDEVERQGLDPKSLRRKAADVASETKEAAMDAAEDEGLTPTQLKEKAARVANKAKESARSEFEDQFGAHDIYP